MKYRNILIRFAWLCLLPLVMVGCTDWDAHYDEDNQKIWAEKTLWEEIASRPQLEEFMELLEQYGYKEMLFSDVYRIRSRRSVGYRWIVIRKDTDRSD